MKTATATMLVLLVPIAGTASAEPTDVTVTNRYRASYDAKREHYCLKFYNGFAEGPRPGPLGQHCQTKAEWARQGVTITHRAAMAIEGR